MSCSDVYLGRPHNDRCNREYNRPAITDLPRFSKLTNSHPPRRPGLRVLVELLKARYRYLIHHAEDSCTCSYKVTSTNVHTIYLHHARPRISPAISPSP